jgi:protein-disulfide isomerase-like protein with CxxC motif
MREFAALDVREGTASLDPEDLALAIVNNIQEAGFMELVHTALRTAVLNLLAEKSGVDRTAWDEAMSAEDEALLAEMIRNGRGQEALYG